MFTSSSQYTPLVAICICVYLGIGKDWLSHKYEKIRVHFSKPKQSGKFDTTERKPKL